MKNLPAQFIWAYESLFLQFEDAITKEYKEYKKNINSSSTFKDVENFFNDISENKEFPGINIVNEFISSIGSHELKKHPGSVFYRARRVDNNETYCKLRMLDNQIYGLTNDESSAPPPGNAKAGRANPHGLPFLYLADNKYTAISEITPYHLCIISVAKFQLKKDIKLVNLIYNGRNRPSKNEDGETINTT